MKRLNDIVKEETFLPRWFGIIVFGAIADACTEEDEDAENKHMEGLCPDRILLNEDWLTGTTRAEIAPAEKPHKAYAYYSPQYLVGQPWSRETTSFAIFSVVYKLLTGKLPYMDNVPEELLGTKEGIKYIKRMRRENELDLSCVPDSYRDFFAKGLALKLEDRYQKIEDTADDFEALSQIFNPDEFKKESTAISSDTDYSSYLSELNNMLAQSNNFDFILDVEVAEKGGLEDLVGMEELKEYLRNVKAILNHPEKAKKYKIDIPNGMLLYGPTGCGKTAVARAFAAECRRHFAFIKSADIASTLVHGTPKILGQLFKQAALYAPFILIFDEIETMIPDRNDPDNKKVAEDTTAFLSELSTCAERGIFVIGTTNRPQFMDSAALRTGRFDKKFYVPLPDEQTRTLMFHNYLHERPIEAHIDYQKLAQLAYPDYVSSDIKQICDEAAQMAFRDDSIITQSLIEQVISNGSPSVSRSELRSYEEARRYMEPANKSAAYINRIGFR